MAASASQVNFPGPTAWRWPVCLTSQTQETMKDVVSPTSSPAERRGQESAAAPYICVTLKAFTNLNSIHQRESNITLCVYLLCRILKGFSYHFFGLIRYRRVIFVPILQARTLHERGGLLLAQA